MWLRRSSKADGAARGPRPWTGVGATHRCSVVRATPSGYPTRHTLREGPKERPQTRKLTAGGCRTGPTWFGRPPVSRHHETAKPSRTAPRRSPRPSGRGGRQADAYNQCFRRPGVTRNREPDEAYLNSRSRRHRPGGSSTGSQRRPGGEYRSVLPRAPGTDRAPLPPAGTGGSAQDLLCFRIMSGESCEFVTPPSCGFPSRQPVSGDGHEPRRNPTVAVRGRGNRHTLRGQWDEVRGIGRPETIVLSVTRRTVDT